MSYHYQKMEPTNPGDVRGNKTDVLFCPVSHHVTTADSSVAPSFSPTYHGCLPGDYRDVCTFYVPLTTYGELIYIYTFSSSKYNI